MYRKKESGTYIYIYIYRERERERERGMLFEYCLSAPIQAKDLRWRIITQMVELVSCKKLILNRPNPWFQKELCLPEDKHTTCRPLFQKCSMQHQ